VRHGALHALRRRNDSIDRDVLLAEELDLERPSDYWRSIDRDVGGRIERKVRAGSGAKPAEGIG